MTHFFLSRELAEISIALSQKAKAGPISRAEAQDLATALALHSDLALKMEQELLVHRMMREGRDAKRIASEVALDAARPQKSDGNVITPDFGRGA